EELRWRILWSLVAIVVGTIVGWFLLDKIDIIEVLKRPIAPYLPGGRLIFTSPAEPFMLTLKVSFALGCLVASPVVIYQIWAFLAPALYEREKRLIIPALAVGVVLFLAGAIACYQWLLRAARGGRHDGVARPRPRLGAGTESGAAASATPAGATRRARQRGSGKTAGHRGYGYRPQNRPPDRTVPLLPSFRRRDGLAVET